ncbi:HAD family hydrolase [Volucribacter amazonae]|uniref:Haloacid dehalogenase-like hydrolase n=1 Tax=Volucribacter amazonae TaxID=256731 RepID=A0A9X4SR11_9PAST|nr:HAD family hydrolase [Volucribacter amazonae]MDG6895976.1 hypothetical protein [Volucribacter amazonae]
MNNRNYTNNCILVDFDNTLFFTDEANNNAYKQAIIYYVPNFDLGIFSGIKRITGKDIKFILNNELNKSVLDKIISHKRMIVNNYIDMNVINKNLYDLLYKLKDDNFIFLVTCGNVERVYSIIKYFNLEFLFSKFIFSKCDDYKYNDIININNSTKVILFEDNINNLIKASDLGAKKEKLFYVNKNKIINIGEVNKFLLD